MNFLNLRRVPRGNARRGYHVHMLRRDTSGFAILRRLDSALLLECSTAEIKTIPSAGYSDLRDRLCFCLLRDPLIDPSIICPVGIHCGAFFRQKAKNRKGGFATHPQEINSEPQIRIRASAIVNNG